MGSEPTTGGGRWATGGGRWVWRTPRSAASGRRRRSVRSALRSRLWRCRCWSSRNSTHRRSPSESSTLRSSCPTRSLDSLPGSTPIDGGGSGSWSGAASDERRRSGRCRCCGRSGCWRYGRWSCCCWRLARSRCLPSLPLSRCCRAWSLATGWSRPTPGSTRATLQRRRSAPHSVVPWSVCSVRPSPSRSMQ